MDLLEPIEVRPGVRNGKPCIVATRITVHDIVRVPRRWNSEAEILADFPELRRDHIRAARVVAAGRERRLAASA